MPPLMLTATEAATVALGLLAARRHGLDADQALAKIRRVLPDLVRMRVEALEATLHFTGAAPAGTRPEAETLLVLAEAALRGRRVDGAYTSSDGIESERVLSPYGLVAHGGRWYAPAYDHDREGAARVSRRPLRLDPARRAGHTRAAGLRRRRLREPHARPRALALRDRGAARHVTAAAAAHFPPTLAELAPEDGGTLLRMRADSLDWVAGLLAGAGCAFSIRRPAALRAAVHALGDRLLAI